MASESIFQRDEISILFINGLSCLFNGSMDLVNLLRKYITRRSKTEEAWQTEASFPGQMYICLCQAGETNLENSEEQRKRNSGESISLGFHWRISFVDASPQKRLNNNNINERLD